MSHLRNILRVLLYKSRAIDFVVIDLTDFASRSQKYKSAYSKIGCISTLIFLTRNIKMSKLSLKTDSVREANGCLDSKRKRKAAASGNVNTNFIHDDKDKKLPILSAYINIHSQKMHQMNTMKRILE